MEQEKSKGTWEGKVSAQVKSSKAQEVWPLVEDFCSLHRWLPTVDTCQQVDGTATGAQPGMIRYCASNITLQSGETTVKWAKEKLIEIDPIQRRLSYEIIDNNVGFKYWVATMQVVATDGDGEGGSEIKWSFVGDPVDGWSYESLVSYYDSSLQSMAKKMEVALSCRV